MANDYNYIKFGVKMQKKNSGENLYFGYMKLLEALADIFLWPKVVFDQL